MNRELGHIIRRTRNRFISMHRIETKIRHGLQPVFDSIPQMETNRQFLRSIQRALHGVFLDLVKKKTNEKRSKAIVKINQYRWRYSPKMNKFVEGECLYEENTIAEIKLRIPQDWVTKSRQGDIKATNYLFESIVCTMTHEILHWKQYSCGLRSTLSLISDGSNRELYLSDIFEIAAWARDNAQGLRKVFKNDLSSARRAIKDESCYDYLVRVNIAFSRYYHSIYWSRHTDAKHVWDEFLRYTELYLKDYAKDVSCV